MTDLTGEAADMPMFTVVRGDPTDAELAAVVAVLALRAQPAAPSANAEATSGWAAYWRAARAPLSPGPGAWRASAR